MSRIGLLKSRSAVPTKEINTTFFLGASVGMILFILLYGFRVLDVTYTDWIYQMGDFSQHQLGWEAFRNSPWYFPIGLHDHLIYPSKISIVYTDSIPGFALLFKCISDILPTSFQYMGIYGLLCFALQGGFSALLVRKFIDNKLICTLSVLLFVYNSVLIYRMFAHTALASQWIILAAWCIWAYSDQMDFRKSLFYWSILFILAPSIHMYFVPMLAILLFFFSLLHYKSSKHVSQSIIMFAVPCLVALAVMYILGAFYGNVRFGDNNEIDVYTMNFNGFINPIAMDHSARVSLFLKELPRGVYQYEGRCYLGLGIILALFGILYLSLYRYKKEKGYVKSHPVRFYAFLACLTLFILSLGTIIRLGEAEILNIWYPNIFKHILAIFRATGRFIWPVYYLIILYVITSLYKYLSSKKYTFEIAFLVLIFIQMVDTSGMLVDYSKYFREDFKATSSLVDPLWDECATKKCHMVFLGNTLNGDDFTLFGRKFLKHGCSLNNFYLARSPAEEIASNWKQYLENLMQGKIDSNTILIFKDNDDFIKQVPRDNINILNIDGYAIIYNVGTLSR